MRISLVEPLGRGWNRMARMLFQPFDPVKWLILGFSAWLAGLASGGGGGGGGGGGRGGDVDPEDVVRGLEDAWEYLLGHPVLLSLGLFLIAFVVIFVVVLTWLSSRGMFIFLDNVVHDRARIVEPWKRFRRLGNSVFLFRLVLGLVTIPIVLGMIVLALVWLWAAFGGWDGPNGLSLALWIVAWTGLLFFFVALGTYISFFLEAFVVPIMYRFDLPVLVAWQYFLALLSSHFGSFILCGLFTLVLFIGVAVCVLVIGLMTCCIGLILLVLPYVGTVLMLPVLVTYRAFTVEYLAQFHPDLVLIRDAAEG
ncbi:MAG: hypothetical protein GY856_43780 [bacterium]|nr:hypothetical protein [bacterium]